MARERGLEKEFRPRLTVHTGRKGQSIDPLDELYFRRPVRTHVREFGALFGAIFLGIAAYSIYRAGEITSTFSWAAPLAALFVAGGYLFPAALRPIWKAWMDLAHVMGNVMTTVILFVAWTLLVIPMSIALKIFRIKVMNQSFREPVESYWEKRDPKHDDFKLLERQF